MDDRAAHRPSSHPDGPDREPPTDRWPSIRPLGWASVVCAVLWLGGFGSFLAVGLGLVGILGRDNVVTDQVPPPGLRLCQLGVALGAVGLVLTGAWLLDLV